MKRTNRFYRFVIWVGSTFLRVIDVRRTIIGVENVPATGGVVLAITHFSYLEFVISEWAVWKERRRLTRFMATKASFEHPVSGVPMKLMGHIPVDPSAGAEAYRYAVDALQAGEIVGVFPETRLSRSFTLLPFKTGAARMAAQSGAPIVPCVIWGSHRIMTRTHKTQLLKTRHTPVTVMFGPAIHVPPDSDAHEVTESLQATMAGMLEQAMDSYPVVAQPGSWWVPAHRGGGAPTADEATEIDSRKQAS